MSTVTFEPGRCATRWCGSGDAFSDILPGDDELVIYYVKGSLPDGS